MLTVVEYLIQYFIFHCIRITLKHSPYKKDENMEIDEKSKSPPIQRKSPRGGSKTKTKRRRIQIDSSSSEEDDTEAQK